SEWKRIVHLLEQRDAVLLVRSHPLGEGRYAPPASVDPTRVRMIGADVVADITPILASIDVLVTDYSSLAFDVGLLAMPVVYFAPDLVEYARQRGFYGRYASVAGSDAAVSWAQTLTQLDTLLADEREFTERSVRSSTLSAEMHAFRDGGNTE